MSSPNEPYVQDASIIKFDEQSERAALEHSDTLIAGTTAELQINPGGKLIDAMMKYYRSSWKEDGRTVFYLLTQSEVCITYLSSFPLLY